MNKWMHERVNINETTNTGHTTTFLGKERRGVGEGGLLHRPLQPPEGADRPGPLSLSRDPAPRDLVPWSPTHAWHSQGLRDPAHA